MISEIHVVGAAILDAGKVLAARRGPQMDMPGVWEFPGGKVEAGEDPASALVREITEELGFEIAVGELIGRSTFSTASRTIILDVYWCTVASGLPTATEHDDLRWLSPHELPALEWAMADIPIVSLMCESWGADH